MKMSSLFVRILLIYFWNVARALVIMQMDSPKTPKVSRAIGSYHAAIIQDNNNNNIMFYLWDIMQAYIEIALDLNLDFYIRPLSELISQLSALFDSIVKIMRPLYDELEADNHRFAIYHPHYKKKIWDGVHTRPFSSLATVKTVITKFGIGKDNYNK